MGRHSSTAWVLVALAAAAYAVAGGYLAENGSPNADEGFYAYASLEAAHGGMPYRDFGYTQTPLLPYLQGAVMSATGFGVRQQRWIDVAFGAAALALAAALWLRSGLGALAAAALAAAWCMSKEMVFYDSIGKTYAAAQLLLVGAGWFLARPRGSAGYLALSALCTAAVGCRLTVAPCALVLLAGFALENRGRVPRALIVGIPLLCALLLIGPFYAAAPGNALFWTWTYHTWNAEYKDHGATLLRSFAFVPAIAALAMLALSSLAAPGSRALGANGRRGAWILAAGLAGWILSAGLSGVFEDYATPCMPLVLLGAGLMLSDGAAASPLRLLATRGGAAALLAAAAAGVWMGPSHVRSGYLDAVDDAGRFIRSSTSPGDLVLTSTPEVALASGRAVVPGTALGKFAITSEMDRATAHRRRIINYGELLDAVNARTARVVVLYGLDDQWNFIWSVPSMRVFSKESRSLLISALSRNYRFVHQNGYFLVFMALDPQEAGKARTG